MQIIQIQNNDYINISNYKQPEKIEEDGSINIGIIHTTDIHGHLLGKKIKTVDSRQEYELGGMNQLMSIVEILRTEYGNNLVWVDSGDQFIGTLISQYFNGSSVTELLNKENLQSSAIGNHEFDLQLQGFQQRIEDSQYFYVASNLKNKTDNENIFKHNKNIVSSQILYIEEYGINIGIIGLTTKDTVSTSSGNVSTIIFQEYREVTVGIAQKMKQQQNVDIVLVVAHLGMICNPIKQDDNDLLTLKLYNKSSTQHSYCQEHDELYSFVDSLPKGLIDGVLGGHTHSLAHHFINGVPVIITSSYARYLSVLYFNIDLKTLTINKDKTIIESPIPVCSQIFANNKICDVDIIDNSVKSNGELHKYIFHGKLVGESKDTKQIIQKYQQIIDEKFGNQSITEVEIPVIKSYQKESSMNNLFCDMMKNVSGSDVSLVNIGMLRIDWPSGSVDYQTLFETMPFDNQIAKVELSGSMLKRIISDIQTAQMKYYGMAGLKVVIDQNGGVQSIQLYDKNYSLIPILDSQIYTMSLPDFLLYGGDDFKNVKKYFHPNPQDVKLYGTVRQHMKEYLQQFQVINTQQEPLVNVNRPRLLLLKNVYS